MVRRSKLPESVRSKLDALGVSLEAIVDGEDRTGEVGEAVDAAVRAALAESRKRRYGSWSTPFSASFAEIIAERLKTLRSDAGWTQAQLAEAMHLYFPTWGRVTVAQVEATSRRLSFEELVVLGALFAVPVVDLLVPTDVTLNLPTTDLAPEVLRELLVGAGGRIGKGGLDWSAAMQVASEPGPRPATDLWRREPGHDR